MKGSSRILDRTSGLLALFLRPEVEDEVERERNEEESRQPAQETDEDGTNSVEGQRRGDGSPLGGRRVALTSLLPVAAWAAQGDDEQTLAARRAAWCQIGAVKIFTSFIQI